MVKPPAFNRNTGVRFPLLLPIKEKQRAKLVNFIGDVHAHFASYKELISKLPDSIQLGDMGLGFDPRTDEDFPDDSKHGFFRGNHDNPEVCRSMESYLGDYGFLHDEDIFFVSGAASVARKWRTEGLNWWLDEELNHDQWEAVFELYGAMQPPIVATHDCPFIVMDKICSGVFGSPQRSVTGMALDKMFDIHQPEMWVFAHHHRFKVWQQEKTLFVALGELDVWDSDNRDRVRL